MIKEKKKRKCLLENVVKLGNVVIIKRIISKLKPMRLDNIFNRLHFLPLYELYLPI